MNVTFFRNISEVNKIGKELETVTTLPCTLKNECSVLRPVIIIQDSGGEVSKNIPFINYMQIDIFGRYYFVDSVDVVRSNLFRFSGRVDVLETYKTQILEQTAIIKRQENVWNTLLDDGSFKTYADPIIITKLFPNGFSGQSFLLAVAGD